MPVGGLASHNDTGERFFPEIFVGIDNAVNVWRHVYRQVSILWPEGNN